MITHRCSCIHARFSHLLCPTRFVISRLDRTPGDTRCEERIFWPSALVRASERNAQPAVLGPHFVALLSASLCKGSNPSVPNDSSKAGGMRNLADVRSEVTLMALNVVGRGHLDGMTALSFSWTHTMRKPPECAILFKWRRKSTLIWNFVEIFCRW